MPFSHSRVAACDQSLLPLNYIIMEACLNLFLLSTMCSSFLQPYFEPQPCSSHIFNFLPQATSAIPAKLGYLESRKSIGVHGKFSVLLVLLFFSIFIWWIPIYPSKAKKRPQILWLLLQWTPIIHLFSIFYIIYQILSRILFICISSLRRHWASWGWRDYEEWGRGSRLKRRVGLKLWILHCWGMEWGLRRAGERD